MNIFRFLADLFHLFSFVILLLQFDKTNSVAGISLKTQILYVVVFVTRYLDLFYKFHSLYTTLMKIVYIGLSCYTVYVMTHKFKKEIESSKDIFPVKYILGGTLVLAGLTSHNYAPSEFLWTFSIWLEAFAILPQLMLLQKTGQAENITTHYIFCLGLYRALYIPNWIYRYFTEAKLDWVAIVAGIVQTAIYSDFFYIYYSRVLHGKKFELPV
ncbi:endoplasmic reticulum retention protein [Scheffersomyces spartinae]|uniref:Endoplasmic reticulum retention protein n=1 Tax=Scheffersomyces spartinae TaxID=45513 RepID=A0A9P7V6Y8_9ASCO|nr:endoplasmic reticulum retention protein [Scheffersomyces spartinae]KAG7192367.1 endoplasmic reticulum retention protein [Scheffersomyces spartinae]